MKRVILLLTLITITIVGYSQKKKYYWTEVKVTDCKARGISPTLQVGNKIVSVGFAYTWTKTSCDEVTYKNAIKVPKVPIGYIIHPNGRRYYNDGTRVFEILGNACGSQTWTPQDFWIQLQNT